MKNLTSKPLGLLMIVSTVSFLGCALSGSVLRAQDLTSVDPENDGREHILTIDHFVPHISTVPANEGERVELFVRERVRRGRHSHRPVVLMVNEAIQSIVPVFDLRFENYSWMAFLAEAGFDVFAMDLQGYGASPRPKMDDPCNTQPSQQFLLIPNPLSEPCEPNYPFRMAIQSDWDEIDAVVDFIRQLRGVDKVSLIGWSRGGPRTGGYAARHPDKVNKLFLYAPAMYNRLGPSDPPRRLPERTFLMQLATIANFFNRWDSQVHCEDQFTPDIREALRATILEFDPLGSTWGTEDLWRAPLQNTLWGWNATYASRIEAPTVIIRGDLDTQAPEPPQRDLFLDLGTEHKVFVHVACSAHQFVWENRHMILLRASREWLRHGTFARHSTGSFSVDTEGNVHEE